MQKDTFTKIASLVLLLAVLSTKVLLEDGQRHERVRLFGLLDAVVRCVDVINRHPADRDTTRTSNETISSLATSRGNPHLKNDPLLFTLKEFVGDAPVVRGFFNVLYENRSPLDPDASIRIGTYNLTTNSTIPTRVWTTSGSGYGSAISAASEFILLIPSNESERIFFTNEPILLQQSSKGDVYALSIPRALKPLLKYWAYRPTDMRTFLSDGTAPPPLIEKGNKLVQSGLLPMVELMTYDQLRAEIIRLASIQNDKSYYDKQIEEALRDSLQTERAKIELFGMSFSRDFFALVFPMAYAFAGYSLFQAARPPHITRKALAPKGKLELGVLLLTFTAMAASVIPIAYATVRHLSFLTSTGLPEQPNLLKYILILSPLCVGFGFLLYGLFREIKRILPNTALHRTRKSGAAVS